ncbi:MAG TPA: glycosyltransferase [Methylomirabilota bacterium]|nr:glycosyltransferase [Methylomirabilota bacterium]
MGTAAPRVLILSASYGSGHNAVARALDASLQAAGAETRIVDHFRDLVHPAFDRWSRRLYGAILRRAPALWGFGYWVGDRLSPSSGLVFGMGSLGTPRLLSLLERERPDLVVSTHPTPAGALSDLRRRGVTRIPHALVYSDFAVHRQWIPPLVDLHCVPAESVRADLIAHGIAPDRVLASGLPVRAEFEQPADPTSARRALGLDLERPVVLAMAGAFGWTGDLPAATGVLRDLPVPLQALIVAGHDGALRARLQESIRGAGRRVRVLGYTDEMRQLMAAADLLVTKAGGVSLAEAIACDLPVVCFGSLPGHERRNERFIVEAGAALRARSAAELGAVVRRTLTEPGLLTDLAKRMREIRRPGAARVITLALLERLAGSPVARP